MFIEWLQRTPAMVVLLSQSIITLARKAAAHVLNHVRPLTPAGILRQWREARIRRSVEARLARMAEDTAPIFAGRALVDGMFDNPNYWLRLSMFRSAVGLSGGDEVGLLGPYNRRRAAATFRTLGIEDIIDLGAVERNLGSYREHARKLLKATKDPAEILEWELPHGVPATYLYDALLRRQRAVVVNLHHRKIEAQLADSLRSIQAAGNIVANGNFDVLVLSHHVDTRWSALTFAAIARGIPVYVLYGNMGQLKFVRFDNAEDALHFVDCPTGEDLASVPKNKALTLQRFGERYLTDYRWAGRTHDLGAIYAFQSSQRGVTAREDIVSHFGWDKERPIVAVYLGNGWDNIHGMGMRNFRDLKDWLEVTLHAANQSNAVNWLFRGHPVDQWYHGANLLDVVPADTSPHVRICEPAWNNSDMLGAADAVITLHGTAGIEFAALGKPVLLADRGWYHDCGFAKWSKTRDEYMKNLATIWWQDEDLSANRSRALLFAGLYFCVPDWQRNFVLGDDSGQQSLYDGMGLLLGENALEIKHEIEGIRRWFLAGATNYHTWTMLRADGYSISNMKR